MESIVSHIESLEKERKRKTAEVILSPTLKVTKQNQKGALPKEESGQKNAGQTGTNETGPGRAEKTKSIQP